MEFVNELDFVDVLNLVNGSDEIVATWKGKEVWRFERVGAFGKWEIETNYGRTGSMTELQMTEYLIDCFAHDPDLTWFFGNCGFLVELKNIKAC